MGDEGQIAPGQPGHLANLSGKQYVGASSLRAAGPVSGGLRVSGGGPPTAPAAVAFENLLRVGASLEENVAILESKLEAVLGPVSPQVTEERPKEAAEGNSEHVIRLWKLHESLGGTLRRLSYIIDRIEV